MLWCCVHTIAAYFSSAHRERSPRLVAPTPGAVRPHVRSSIAGERTTLRKPGARASRRAYDRCCDGRGSRDRTRVDRFKLDHSVLSHSTKPRLSIQPLPREKGAQYLLSNGHSPAGARALDES
eukprot:366217-Chlamydomonas_euryale.AAC.9